MTTTKEQFKLLSNKERMEVIEKLDYLIDKAKILELLTSVDIETLDTSLLIELGRAYHNNFKYEKALTIFEMIPEEQRDARWYYCCGYSYSQLDKKVGYTQKALDMFDKAVQLAEQDSEYPVHCAELVYYENKLIKALENDKEKYPYIAKKYAEYLKNKIDEENQQKVKTYKKITVEDIKNINDSWDITEPMWHTINIYDSYEDYLQSAKTFTLEQRYLLAITWYFAEVNNGGHDQFFFNSTGIVWEDALNGFKYFGMNEFAANFQKVIDYCGGRISFDREERYYMLESLEEKNEEDFFEFLDKADNFVYDYTGEDNELTYIKANPEKFVFDGYYYVFR